MMKGYQDGAKAFTWALGPGRKPGPSARRCHGERRGELSSVGGRKKSPVIG